MSATTTKTEPATDTLDDITSFEMILLSGQFLSPGGSMGSDIICSFYLEKNHRIAIHSATAKAREKIKHLFGFIEF
jgi:hypothetical protein